MAVVINSVELSSKNQCNRVRINNLCKKNVTGPKSLMAVVINQLKIVEKTNVIEYELRAGVTNFSMLNK